MKRIITILLDEQPHEIPAGSSLAQLLALLERPPDSAATAVNGRFVAREARPGTVLGRRRPGAAVQTHRRRLRWKSLKK